MNRLTYRNESGVFSKADENVVLEKLAKYEDMEEQDLMLILMAPPGTKIYTVDLECEKPEGTKCPKECGDCIYGKYTAGSITPKNKWQMALFSRGFGGDAFLTKEEAKAKAEKLNKAKS